MRLILQVVGAAAAPLGAGASKTFEGTGGTIGRLPDNFWVIPSQYVSGRHARIHFRDGAYFLEDTSSNGVFLGSRDNRIARGQHYPLQAGDRFYIDEFEISVSLQGAPSRIEEVFGEPSPAAQIPEDIFGDPAPAPSAAVAAGVETDPLKALGLFDAPRAPPGPRLEEIEGKSLLSERVSIPETRQPAPAPAPPAAPASQALIPDDWEIVPGTTAAPAPPAPVPPAPPSPPAAPPSPATTISEPVRPRIPRPAPFETPAAPAPPAPRPSVQPPRAATAPPAAPAVPAPPAPATQTGRQPQLDLVALLEAAGVPPGAATPGVARELGEILRIVVAGVMEVLGAREKIKEEFRIRHTTFKATDNNPLKFSANVEDALYNLLVKRNPAYLGPVDAFDDAFADIRNHQMAMLAGMRVAYEAMLRRFEPGRLQEHFDKKGARGALLPLPARMRYWEQFSEYFDDMVKDPEASFRDLFGAEFTRAYEEQMLRLRTLSRSQKRDS